MFGRKLALFSVMVLTAGGVGSAHAEDSGWYVAGSAGAYFRQQSKSAARFTRPLAAPAVGVQKLTYGTGVNVQAAVGRRLTPHLRLEAELGYTAYDGDRLNPNAESPFFPRLDGRAFYRQDGSRFTRLTGALAGFYDFSATSGGITPYIGGGVGASANRRSAGLFQSADGAVLRTGGGAGTEGFGFVEGGLAVPVTPKLSFVPSYRYAHYFRSGQDRAHVVSAGLRYSF